MEKKKSKITVFYDGACGLCAREINHYRKVANKEDFEWVDITTTPTPFEKLGFKVSDGLKALHAQDSDGSIHIGVDAFILIWNNLKNWKWLAFITRLPLIKHTAHFLYKHFANWRFKKLGYEE